MISYTKEILACTLLFLLTWVPFAQVLSHDFVNFDDEKYVTQNMEVQAGINHFDSVWWAFTENRTSSHWHPLTWLSLLLDFEWHGLEPYGFHLTNLLLHEANVLLLFVLLRWGTGAVWRSAVVAGLFADSPSACRIGGLGFRTQGCFEHIFLALDHFGLLLLRRPAAPGPVLAGSLELWVGPHGQTHGGDFAVYVAAFGFLAAGAVVRPVLRTGANHEMVDFGKGSPVDNGGGLIGHHHAGHGTWRGA